MGLAFEIQWGTDLREAIVEGSRETRRLLGASWQETPDEDQHVVG